MPLGGASVRSWFPWLFLLLILAAAPAALAQGLGTVTGVVVSTWDGTPLPGVIVTLRGTTLAAQTDASGRFQMVDVPSGDQVLRFSKSGFAAAVVTDVRVLTGQSTTVNGNLRPEFYSMEEFEVTAEEFNEQSTQILFERQQSVTFTDSLGSDFLSRVGAGDAAEAVSKVTGATIVDGKFAVIRGLSDRYTSTTLNGGEVPTADPYRKAAQLDLFPSAMIDRVVVSKTFTPDQPGGFTGGAINLITKSFPEKFVFNFSLGTAYNTQGTFNDGFLSYNGGATDWLALDDGTRALPAVLEPIEDLNALPAPPFSNEADAQAYQDLLRSFGSTQLGPERNAPPLNHNFSFSIGDTTMVLRRRLGYFAALSYDRKFSQYEGESARFFPDTALPGIPPAQRRQYDEVRSIDEVSWAAVANLTYELLPGHEISFNFLHNQSSEDLARLRVGKSSVDQFNGADISTSYLNELHFTERSLRTYQLHGRHEFEEIGGLNIDWLASLANTTQVEPDLRLFNFNYFPDGSVSFGSGANIPEPAIPTRYFRDLNEDNQNYKLDFTQPFSAWSGLESKLKFGGYHLHSERQFSERTFGYQPSVAINADPFALPNQFVDRYTSYSAVTNRGRVSYQFASQLKSDIGNALYFGEQTIQAGYLMTDFAVTPTLRFIGGVRYETTDFQVESTSRNQTGTFPAGLEVKDWLPAAGLAWSFTPTMNLRANFAKTVARPTYREFAAYRSYDVTGDEILQGNPDLTSSLIDNYDLRWEWFRRPGELLSVGGFFKKIANPIERRALDRNGDIVTYTNFPEALVYGVELEARTKLDWVDPLLDQFNVGFNVALIESVVDNPADIQSEKQSATGILQPSRPLFDQSPYVISADLTYDNPASGTVVTMAFNVSGERLYLVNITGYDVYEQPAPQLDLIISQRLGKHWKLKFSARNLLDPEYRRIYGQAGEIPGEPLYLSYTKGRTFGISLSFDY